MGGKNSGPPNVYHMDQGLTSMPSQQQLQQKAGPITIEKINDNRYHEIERNKDLRNIQQEGIVYSTPVRGHIQNQGQNYQQQQQPHIYQRFR